MLRCITIGTDAYLFSSGVPIIMNAHGVCPHHASKFRIIAVMFLNSLCHCDVVSVCVKESLSLLVKQELSDKGAATMRIRITTHAPDKCGNMSAAIPTPFPYAGRRRVQARLPEVSTAH